MNTRIAPLVAIGFVALVGCATATPATPHVDHPSSVAVRSELGIASWRSVDQGHTELVEARDRYGAVVDRAVLVRARSMDGMRVERIQFVVLGRKGAIEATPDGVIEVDTFDRRTARLFQAYEADVGLRQQPADAPH